MAEVIVASVSALPRHYFGQISNNRSCPAAGLLVDFDDVRPGAFKGWCAKIGVPRAVTSASEHRVCWPPTQLRAAKFSDPRFGSLQAEFARLFKGPNEV